MKKMLVTLLAASVLLSACGRPQTFDGKLYPTYGIVNESELKSDDLRHKVQALIPISHALRDLGSSLIPATEAKSAHERILAYLLKYPRQVVASEELMIVAGIVDYQRRIRELRKEHGWKILSGETAKKLNQRVEGIDEDPEVEVSRSFAEMKTDDYYLVDTVADQDAARRWHVANRVRNRDVGVRERVLEYLLENVGKSVFGEELAYVAKDAGDWPRRIRELRTEYGWPVTTKTSGRPDLPIGVYCLEEDRQAPEHDRHISDGVRSRVMMRDGYACKNCGWSHALWNPSDPRHLELHHILEHVHKGDNTVENLVTLCTVCHDDVHAGRLDLSKLTQ
jgi:hypothetical protein